MRGLDDYYADDSDAFPDAEELAERVEQLEAENRRLRERIRKVWLDLSMEADEFESVYGRPATVPFAVDMIVAALDGDA